MHMATEVIVLSSPGETEHLQKHDNLDGKAIFGESPSRSNALDLPSPSELFRAPRRSKYFAEPDKQPRQPQNNAKTDQANDIGIAIDAKETPATEKPKRKTKKTADGPKAAQSLTAADDQSKKAAPAKKPRKPSTRRTAKTSDGPNKTLVGRVGKSSATQTKKPAKKAAPSVSQEPPVEPNNAKEQEKIDWDQDGLNLEEAVKRRLDWTPTKENSRHVDIGTESVSNSSTTRSFGSLLSGYGFNGNTHPHQARKSCIDGLTKRRRIELVDDRDLLSVSHAPQKGKNRERLVEATPVAQLEPKAKEGRKKPSTLTSRVTACYFTSASDTRTTNALVTISDTGVCPEGAGQDKPTRKGKAKARQIPKPVEYSVLAPEAAVKALGEQDLIFGTCSQLEREDSPTTLRNVQLAITASEECTTGLQNNRFGQRTVAETPSTVWKGRFATSRNLWLVAARDGIGGVVQEGVMDLVDLTESPQTSTIKGNTEHKDEAPAPERSRKTTKTAPEADPSVPKVGREGDRATAVTEESSVVEDPSTTLGVTTTEKATETKTRRRSPKMPDYSAFADSRLKAQITKFGFKQVKSRKKMIELLTQCWEAKHAKADAPTAGEVGDITTDIPGNGPSGAPNDKLACSVPAKAPSTVTATVSSIPQGPLLQPTQQPGPSNGMELGKVKEQRSSAPTSSFKDIDEIEDSEEELIPSPSRIQHQYALPRRAAKCQPLQTSPAPSLSQATGVATQPSATQPSSKSGSATLFQSDAYVPDMALQITKAVRAQPRLHRGLGRQRISWHEKILMYDPIVLEEFATWLNTEGLALVDEDREVSAGYVREWCESKGICCCWKRNELM